MSSKAFRLVDELKRSPEPKPKTPSLQKSAPSAPIASKSEVDSLPSQGVYIADITAMDGGEWVSVTFIEGKSRRCIRLLTRQYAELKPTLGRVTDEAVEALTEAGKLCDAIQKGMELLGYGPMSRRRLLQKLTLRKIDRDRAAEAVSYLESHGYLVETEDAFRFAEQGVRKLWGPNRIRDDLFARGFPSQVVARVMAELDEVDFADQCAVVVSKKYGAIPDDPGERRKMVAALMRLGYTSEHIREAMKHNH